MKKITACLIFIITFGIYLFTMVPAVTEDDSGELAAVGATLGTAHSPGYPLYCLASKSMAALVPWANNVYRVNLVSAIFIAATGVVIFLTVFSQIGNILLSAALSLLFCFSEQVWAMANVTEVYGIAAFIAALILFIVVKFNNNNINLIHLYAIAFLFGLGLNAHYTLGLILPGLLWWVIYNRKNFFDKVLDTHIVQGSLFALAGFSVFLFIYLRALRHPVICWEDPQTLDRLWQVIARLRYGTISLAQGGPATFSIDLIIKKIIFYFSVMRDNFTIFGTALFLAGLWQNIKDKNKGLTVILFFLAAGPGFLIIANVGLDNTSMELLKRFFFLSFIFAAVIMADGLKIIPFNQNFGFNISIFSLLLPCYLLYTNYNVLNYRNNYLFFDYAKNILRTLPKNSLLLSDRADEMEFAVGYFHIAEKRRKDIDFIDCNAGITRSIYGDNYYRIWGKPRLELRERIEKNLISSAGRPVYYATFDPDMIGIKRYHDGLLFNTQTENFKYYPYDKLYSLRVPSVDILYKGRGINLLLSHFQLLGNYFIFAGDPKKADEIYCGLSAYDKKGVWISNAAYLFHQKGYLNFAEKYYNMAIGNGHGTSDIYSNLGVVYKTRGNDLQAKECYLQAIKKNKNNPQAHSNLAALYWSLKDWKGAFDEFQKVVELEPGNAQAKTFLLMARQRLTNK